MEKINEELLKMFKTSPDFTDLKILVNMVVNKRLILTKLENDVKLLKKELDLLNVQLFNTMLQKNLTTLKTSEGITITIYSESAYYIDKAYKEEFLKVARNIGWESFIKEDFSWRSLQVLMKDLKNALTDEGLTTAEKGALKLKVDAIEKCLTENKKNVVRVLGLKTLDYKENNQIKE